MAVAKSLLTDVRAALKTAILAHATITADSVQVFEKAPMDQVTSDEYVAFGDATITEDYRASGGIRWQEIRLTVSAWKRVTGSDDTRAVAAESRVLELMDAVRQVCTDDEARDAAQAIAFVGGQVTTQADDRGNWSRYVAAIEIRGQV